MSFPFKVFDDIDPEEGKDGVASMTDAEYKAHTEKQTIWQLVDQIERDAKELNRLCTELKDMTDNWIVNPYGRIE